uniref:Capsid protein n=1 Tax=Pilk tombus-like virus TaxID=2716734 RepID=A0A6G7PSL2_9TOMB|nr:hypothetical protein [Pilk tombus-like virus]
MARRNKNTGGTMISADVNLSRGGGGVNARRKQPRRRRSRVRTVNNPNPSWGRSLPAAYASHVRPRFNVQRRGDSVIVNGCDLVYSIPNVVATDEQPIFTVIPSNPAYWLGTRIGQLAPAYMNYRPLSVVFSYIPQVAVTQAGTVFMGTLWNGAPGGQDIQQTLVTSNGGCLTQCYVPADTRIKLGANLQQNLFTISGEINPDTSPFIFLAGVAGASVTPGYFYVTYSYEFKNPIGMSWVYNRQYLDDVDDLSEYSTSSNASIVLSSSLNGYGPGTVLDLEAGGGVFYHGSSVNISTGVNGYLFTNSQEATTQYRLMTMSSDLALSNVVVAVVYKGVRYPINSFTSVTGAQPESHAYFAKSSRGGESWRFFPASFTGEGQAWINPTFPEITEEDIDQEITFINNSGQILGIAGYNDPASFALGQIPL